MSNNSSHQYWYTKAEAADYLRTSQKTITRMEKAGYLNGRRLPGKQRKRYRRVDLDNLMEAA